MLHYCLYFIAPSPGFHKENAQCLGTEGGLLFGLPRVDWLQAWQSPTPCLTCVPQCWIIRCSSSCTSSTQRRLGSSSRRICLFTSSSNDTSGTKRAGLGPCRGKQQLKGIIYIFFVPRMILNPWTEAIHHNSLFFKSKGF